MTYSSKLAEMSRAPVTLVVLTLDWCANTFGSSPCTATGTACYNTYPTCKDRAHYVKTTRDYTFCSAATKLPFYGPRPYVESVAYLPTEIKDNALTVSGRVKVTFYDEEETKDVGLDPYYATRPSIKGFFWRKFLTRNANIKGRPVAIYEGFDDLAESEFEKKWEGVVKAVTRQQGIITIECVDLLASLADIEMPEESDIELVADATVDLPTLTVDDVTGLDAAGYVRIDDEIIEYASKNATTNQLLECTRGAFGTGAAEHSTGAAVQKCRHYAPQNPYDILYNEMLMSDAAIDPGQVDQAAFTKLKTDPVADLDFTALISQPTNLQELFFEIIKVLDCRAWVNEDQQITICKNLPNEGGRSYVAVTDDANIIENSASVDDNLESRITRVLLYWEMSCTGDMPGRDSLEESATDDVSDFSYRAVARDIDAESANEYGDIVKEKIFCRWIHKGYADEDILDAYVRNLAARYLIRRRDPMPILSVSLGLKDEEIAVGDFPKVTTDEIQEKDGSDITAAPFQVTRKERAGNVITVEMIKLSPNRICTIGPDTMAEDYEDATEADKEYGYVCDENGEMPGGAPGYQIY